MIINNVNVNKLHDELNTKGIYPNPVLTLADGSVNFTFTNVVDMDLVQQIIDAHDPTPIPPEPTDKERIEQLENMILMMMEVM